MNATDESVDDDNGDDEAEFSLEQLGAAYAQAAMGRDPLGDSAEPTADDVVAALIQGNLDPDEPVDDPDFLIDDPDDEASQAASPEMIVEAALFVGHPDNKSLSAARLASLIRDFTPEEITEIIDQLNASYRAERQALRIVCDEDEGYRMVLAPDVQHVRAAFTTKVRETRLNQSAVDVLSLVAYQPGTTTSEVSDRLGRDSGSLLNQMVRRRLLESRRQADAESGKMVTRFFPAERLLVLLGLDSIDDLPQVEETNL